MDDLYNYNKQPVYVTKWALTAGIMKFDVGQGHFVPSDSNKEQTYFSARWGNYNAIFVGVKDWTYSLDEAKERVYAAAERKLKSLAKMVKKLKEFEPKVVEPAKEG